MMQANVHLLPFIVFPKRLPNITRVLARGQLVVVLPIFRLACVPVWSLFLGNSALSGPGILHLSFLRALDFVLRGFTYVIWFRF